jgi:hypothetical protein
MSDARNCAACRKPLKGGTRRRKFCEGRREVRLRGRRREARFPRPAVRAEGFSQEKPDGGDGWAKGGIADPPLYYLPEVRKAVEFGQTVYVSEGEKCGDVGCPAP